MKTTRARCWLWAPSGPATVHGSCERSSCDRTYVTSDDETCRLVYSVVEGQASHYNAAVQVFPEGDGSRVIWTIDLLPNELAPAIGGMMDEAVKVMKKRLAED